MGYAYLYGNTKETVYIIVDTSSHYEYLATYVDNILIWSKDSMRAVTSPERSFSFMIFKLSILLSTCFYSPNNFIQCAH